MDVTTSTEELKKMSKDLIAKIKGFYPVVDQLSADLIEMTKDEIEVPAGKKIISAGSTYDYVYLIKDGWVLRSRTLDHGGRQIVNVAVAGDFLCFNSTLFESSEFDLTAKTKTCLFRLEMQAIDTLMQKNPGLAAALVWANAHEESLLAERLVSLGRRDATERLAHVVCEIASRLEIVEQHAGDVLYIPLIQEDFADILGLSVIHVTRTFRRLEERGALQYNRGRLLIRDMKILRKIAGFDDHYLHFTRRSDIRREVR